MRSQRIIKQTIKSEQLPQTQNTGQTSVLTGRRSKNSVTSNVYTVKETTLERRVKRSYKDGTGTSDVITSSNLKQGTNSGFTSQNKIPVSNKEESQMKIIRTTRTTTKNNIPEGTRVKRYTKRDVDKIIKIQRWWRRMLSILKGYKIRDSLRSENDQNYVVKDQKIYTEEVISNENQQFKKNSSYSNINDYKEYNYNVIKGSSSKNPNYLSPDMHMLNSSSSQNYIQTVNEQVVSQTSPRIVPSVSTSPSVKSRYIIETKKVEIYKKPKNTCEEKYVKESSYRDINSISNHDVKKLIKDIWNEENYCSTVESLICLGENDKGHNVSQNSILLEEYEEEIRKLKKLLIKKDDDLNDLMSNLKENERKLKMVKMSKNITTYKNNYNYDQNDFDFDSHELQIISTKMGWNDVNIPSPINEIFIEQIKNELPQRMQYIEGMQIMGN